MSHRFLPLPVRLIFLIAFIALLVGCNQSSIGGDDGGGTAGDFKPTRVQVVTSGGTRGWLVPCGCASAQLGGMPRRATFINDLLRQDPESKLLYVDAGGAPRGLSDYARTQFEAVLQGEIELDIAAHNIGVEELRLGVDYLAKTQKELGIPFLASNLNLDTPSTGSSHSPFASEIVVQPTNATSVRILGVLDEYYAPLFQDGANKLEIVPVEQVLREKILTRKKRGKTNPKELLVVLAYVREGRLQELASQFPEVDLFLGGPTHPVAESVAGTLMEQPESLEGQPVPPTRVGPTLLMSATNKGKFLAHAPVQITAEKKVIFDNPTIVDLDARFADDDAQLKIIHRFYKQLKEQDYSASEIGRQLFFPAATSSAEVAGVDVCAKCHEEEYEIWRKSKHAAAWKTLEEEKVRQGLAWADPSCQICHTTAYGHNGGFQSVVTSAVVPAKKLNNVGCESCHGPSKAHADDFAKSKPEKVKTAMFTKEIDAVQGGSGQEMSRVKKNCVQCHDQENSPKFNLGDYWKKINHSE